MLHKTRTIWQFKKNDMLKSSTRKLSLMELYKVKGKAIYFLIFFIIDNYLLLFYCSSTQESKNLGGHCLNVGKCKSVASFGVRVLLFSMIQLFLV